MTREHLTTPRPRKSQFRFSRAQSGNPPAGVDIAYDARAPLPTADGRPPLFMIGQPKDASGFATLASHFPDRTVVTYDPRGLGRSTAKTAGSIMRPRSKPTTCTP